MQPKRPRFNPLILALALAGVLMIWSVLGTSDSSTGGSTMSYSTVVHYFENNQVTAFTLDRNTSIITLTLKEGKQELPEITGATAATQASGGLLSNLFSSSTSSVGATRNDDGTVTVRYKLPYAYVFIENVQQYIDSYDAANPTAPMEYDYTTLKESIPWMEILFYLGMLGCTGFLLFSMMRGGAGGGGIMNVGKAKVKDEHENKKTATFADVAGEDEEKEELKEVVEFLKSPDKFNTLGARIPHGVLLVGPPGTGKTLLARACAGEAGVPFYSISGSDFVEMFVGVGASCVRDLFKQAKENSPCIIFVDEIDAVGRQRGSGTGGGHDEREQTLNQLLVEMDGFGDREGVILIAATNRPDILDPALLRPGRFDRQIPVTNPDLAGREQILRVHAKNKPLAEEVDVAQLAKRTAGMSGADLANVLNEAALLTARIGGNVITYDALEEATDRVVGGPRRQGKIISEHEKKVTAYHEGGHTLSAWALKDIERVYKVTILARGRTGGHAMTSQEDDKGMYTRDELFSRLVFAMGGRAAEELVFGAPTTGASSDIENATKIARSMLTEYGFSPELGTVKYGKEQGDPFSQMGGGGSIEYSDEVASKIDEQMRYLLERAHEQAYDILRNNRYYLDKLAEALLEKETLRRPDLERIFDGIEPREAFDVFPGEDDRFPRQIGYAPVKTPVELAKERGEELPKRMTLLDASRAARERRLAGEEPKGEVGFNFGQHAGDYVDPDTARELGSTPTNQGKESTDTKRAGAQPEQPAQPSEPAERPTARPAARPATGGGKHHKPDAGADAEAETSQWFSPGWDEKDRRKNPYAREDDKQEDN